MTALYALATVAICFAALMIATELALDALALMREWARER